MSYRAFRTVISAIRIRGWQHLRAGGADVREAERNLVARPIRKGVRPDRCGERERADRVGVRDAARGESQGCCGSSVGFVIGGWVEGNTSQADLSVVHLREFHRVAAPSTARFFARDSRDRVRLDASPPFA